MLRSLSFFFFVKCLFNTSNSLKVDSTIHDVIASHTQWWRQSVSETDLFRNVELYCTELYLVHICTLVSLFYVSVLLVHYICYHHCIQAATCFGPQVTILSSTDTLCEQGQQNTCPAVNTRLKSSVLCAATKHETRSSPLRYALPAVVTPSIDNDFVIIVLYFYFYVHI